MDDSKTEIFKAYQFQLNNSMTEHTKLLKITLDLYQEMSCENMIDPNENNQKKLNDLKDILIQFTLFGARLLQIVDEK